MTGLVDSNPKDPKDPVMAEREVRAKLRQAIWEASQFIEYAEIQSFVVAVLREISEDEE